MRYRLPCTFLLLALAARCTLGADHFAEENLDPDEPYRARTSNPVTYEVSFSAVVTPPNHTQVLKIWMPLPQSGPGQEVEEGELSSFPMHVEPKLASEPLFGNKFAYFE